jgi:hypothetical protein
VSKAPCGDCRREVKWHRPPTGRPLLAYDTDYCRTCARPVSEAAKKRAPTDPFVAFARRIRPQREPAMAVKPGHDSRAPLLKAVAV